MCFVSRISPLLEHSATYSFCFVACVTWTACVLRKFEGVFNKEPSKQPHCLVIVKLDFVVLSLIILNLFSLCFRFEPEQAFRTLEEGLIVCPATYLI